MSREQQEDPVHRVHEMIRRVVHELPLLAEQQKIVPQRVQHGGAVDLVRECLRLCLLDRILVRDERRDLLPHGLGIEGGERAVELGEAVERRLHWIEPPPQVEIAAHHGRERCGHAVTACLRCSATNAKSSSSRRVWLAFFAASRM